MEKIKFSMDIILFTILGIVFSIYCILFLKRCIIDHYHIAHLTSNTRVFPIETIALPEAIATPLPSVPQLPNN